MPDTTTPLPEAYPDTWAEAQHLNGEGRAMLHELEQLRTETIQVSEELFACWRDLLDLLAITGVADDAHPRVAEIRARWSDDPSRPGRGPAGTDDITMADMADMTLPEGDALHELTRAVLAMPPHPTLTTAADDTATADRDGASR